MRGHTAGGSSDGGAAGDIAKAATAELVATLRLPPAARNALMSKASGIVPTGTVVAVIEQRHSRDAVGVLRPMSEIPKVGSVLLMGDIGRAAS